MADKEQILEAIRDTGGTVGADGKITGGNLAKVADRLGVARKTLFNRMKAYGLKGTSGRPKKKFGRSSRRYAVGAGVAVAAVIVGGALLRNKPSTST